MNGASGVGAYGAVRAAAPPPGPGGVHTVERGETLSGIAQRYGTDVATLVRLNDVRNPDLIHPGQRLALPEGATQSYTIEYGDTLSGIAADHGVSLRAVLSANPRIIDPNRIYPGDRLTVPARDGAARTDSPPTVAEVGETRRAMDGALSLSRADVLNIKKTLQTEWVQSAGEAQAHGVIDTILNRTASGRWGDSVADVVNSHNQFSDVNGPISRRVGRNSVEDIPASRISDRVDRLVDGYLAERAAGRPSSIGSHLNYANPHYSSRGNLDWIMALDGPVLGRGDAIHRHGTVPELERHRPGAFAVVLPGAAPAPAPAGGTGTTPGGRIDGDAVAAANGVEVKSSSVRIDRLHASMEPAIRAVADAARRLGLPTPVITSGNDSRHMNGSLHYADRALDFRGNNISVAQGRALEAEVRRVLGDRYDVAFETFANQSNNHLHVEFDPN
ncbi:LysM peptidoglycan-binding domain-containing protein [Sphingomonas lenta]|uniref:LysM peptidoglycan-binding domain-containing protein n=1 Tax=Sphingomonas lenta TaxID=1141887 RepID=UPI001595578D|nr:LysM peptidoglycan-binding domain-containing protein [Sphingomonas lenta]